MITPTMSGAGTGEAPEDERSHSGWSQEDLHNIRSDGRVRIRERCCRHASTFIVPCTEHGSNSSSKTEFSLPKIVKLNPDDLN